MLVRLAALSAMDTAPASWLVNLQVGGATGPVPESLVGVLFAVAPVVGTARIVSAAGSMVRALGLAKAGAGHGDASA